MINAKVLVADVIRIEDLKENFKDDHIKPGQWARAGDTNEIVCRDLNGKYHFIGGAAVPGIVEDLKENFKDDRLEPGHWGWAFDTNEIALRSLAGEYHFSLTLKSRGQITGERYVGDANTGPFIVLSNPPGGGAGNDLISLHNRGYNVGHRHLGLAAGDVTTYVAQPAGSLVSKMSAAGFVAQNPQNRFASLSPGEITVQNPLSTTPGRCIYTDGAWTYYMQDVTGAAFTEWDWRIGLKLDGQGSRPHLAVEYYSGGGEWIRGSWFV
ncbi:MAG: hypothetical protein FWC23_05305 [Chitinispirillia bacterium]|nr:hypothetical protein [Chitinispirillia bacterium]MCL2268586.1 hypothetical protein [Chitinispirillia bacterium]